MSNPHNVDTKADEKIVNNFTNRQLVSKIDKTFDDLVLAPSKEINSLPENIFVNYFLPFFCGEKTQQDRPTIFAEWISIAGSPVKDVRIIDAQNKELFVVPGLMDSTVIDKFNEKDGASLYKIFTNYELHKAHLPVLGERYLADTLQTKIPELTKKSDTFQSDKERWNYIFQKYNKIKQTDNSAVSTSQQNNNDDDELIISDDD